MAATHVLNTLVKLEILLGTPITRLFVWTTATAFVRVLLANNINGLLIV